MIEDFSREIFFEKLLLPGTINGSRFDSENTEIPLVGIKGDGSMHKRDNKKSVWVNGIILSPNVIGNNSCAIKSYIEGIVTCDGHARLLESISDFPAYERSCFDYQLRIKEPLNNNFPEFEGEVFSRRYHEGSFPRAHGNVYLSMNSSWSNRAEGGSEIVYSLPRHNRRIRISGDLVPSFWKTFLGEIEERGFDHPYAAVTEKLMEERKSLDKKTFNFKPNSGDYPF